jgi:hypothetical protein
VRASALAAADPEVRGRAIEGRGFADELLAQTDTAASSKHLDDALSDYEALRAVDMSGMKELGMYHEARVQLAKGDKAKALDLLKEVHKSISEPAGTHKFAYLEFVVDDRLRELDPSALPPKAAFPPQGGAGSGVDTSDPKIQELLRQMQEKAKQKGGAPQ